MLTPVPFSDHELPERRNSIHMFLNPRGTAMPYGADASPAFGETEEGEEGDGRRENKEGGDEHSLGKASVPPA